MKQPMTIKQLRDKFPGIINDHTVVISVNKGVAEVCYVPLRTKVIVIDYDNDQDGIQGVVEEYDYSNQEEKISPTVFENIQARKLVELYGGKQ